MNQRVKMNSRSRINGQFGVLLEIETNSPRCRNCMKVKALKREMNIPQHLKFYLSISRFGIQYSTSVIFATNFLSSGRKPVQNSNYSLPASMANYFSVTGENSPKVVTPVGTNRQTFLFAPSLNKVRYTAYRKVST